ncbi:hypothetical protein CJF31_00010996 [Rutstroemia sp. NJR-2017a BVV2]|nr:hypothetical protein CJF31_00010996 [Rutstroemia sp. NJR-2017a BVV2]
MSGALDLLKELEKETPKTRGKPRSAAVSRSSSIQSRRGPIPKPRPTSLPPGPSQTVSYTSPSRPTRSTATTPRTSNEYSDRSRSQGPDSRRISFAEPRRPGVRPATVFTKNDALSSGFPFVPKLNKYGFSEREWTQFNHALLEAADVAKVGRLGWMMKKDKICTRIRKDLQYGGDIKSFLAKWNKGFRKRGFMVLFELPSETAIIEPGATPEEIKQAKKDAKRFRLIVQPGNTSSASIYSRGSMAESMSREGAIKKHPDDELAARVNASFPQNSSRRNSPVELQLGRASPDSNRGAGSESEDGEHEAKSGADGKKMESEPTTPVLETPDFHGKEESEKIAKPTADGAAATTTTTADEIKNAEDVVENSPAISPLTEVPQPTTA